MHIYLNRDVLPLLSKMNLFEGMVGCSEHMHDVEAARIIAIANKYEAVTFEEKYII